MATAVLAKPVNLERVIVCFAFLDRRIKLMSEAIFDPSCNLIIPGTNNDFDSISDDIYFAMFDVKNTQDFTRCPWYMKFIK